MLENQREDCQAKIRQAAQIRSDACKTLSRKSLGGTRGDEVENGKDDDDDEGE